MKKKPDWTPLQIASLRGYARLTKQDLADALEVSWTAVYRWENSGRRPSMLAKRKLDALAEKVGFEG